MKRRMRMRSLRQGITGRLPVPLTPRQRARVARGMVRPAERYRLAMRSVRAETPSLVQEVAR